MENWLKPLCCKGLRVILMWGGKALKLHREIDGIFRCMVMQKRCAARVLKFAIQNMLDKIKK